MSRFSVSVGISNHHVHLTEELFQKLFHQNCEPAFYISQKGEFATEYYVTLKGPKGVLEHVRVMGPNREYNQVEISCSDAYFLGVHPPVVRSGTLEDAVDIYVCYQGKEYLLAQSCILAQSHIHMNPTLATQLGVVDQQIVSVKINKERSGIIDAYIKVSNNGELDFHIDRDQANAFLLKNGDVVEVES